MRLGDVGQPQLVGVDLAIGAMLEEVLENGRHAHAHGGQLQSVPAASHNRDSEDPR
jgi:hypothetical protein